MTRRPRIYAALSIAALLATASPLSADSLPEAVGRALDISPQVLSSEFGRAAAGADVDAVRGLYKPRIGFTAQGGARGNEEDDGGTYGLAASLNQPIYDGGETDAAFRRSKAQYAAARSRYEETLSVVALEAAMAYIEVQRLRQGQAITSANLAQLKAIARRVRLRAGAGFANLADVYQAEAKVEGARDDLTRVEQQLDDAIDDFIRRTGAAPGRLEPASLSRSAMPESVAEAVRLAKQHSPAVLAVTYDAIAAAAGADVQAAALAPRLNLKLGLDYDPGVDGFSNENRGASALLMFKYDLFDGGTRKARARQSRLRARASAEDARDTRDAIEAEVRETWNAIQASGRRLTHLKARAKAARKSLDINLKRYEAGKASLDMLLDLQNEAATSEIAYLNELSAGRYNACRILAATGGLLPALGLERWLAGAGQ